MEKERKERWFRFLLETGQEGSFDVREKKRTGNGKEGQGCKKILAPARSYPGLQTWSVLTAGGAGGCWPLGAVAGTEPTWKKRAGPGCFSGFSRTLPFVQTLPVPPHCPPLAP